jgi:quercetin dioxygenase-like cupin family protein
VELERSYGCALCVTLHHQDAAEVVFVLEGSFRLLLDVDETVVEAGDLLVMPGVDHAFITGPAGNRLLCFALGMTPAR